MSAKLINRKQFFISALVGGPMVAGSVAAFNLWALQKKCKAIFMLIAGLSLNLLLEAFLTLLVYFILRPLGIDRGIPITIIVFGGGQILFAFAISRLLKINKLDDSVFPADSDYYGYWQLIPISLLSLAYLIVHIDMPVLFAPFPNMILLFYLIPHVYFYNKIKCIFKSATLVIICRWMIAILACYMPLAFVLDVFLPLEIMDMPMFLAEYYIYTLLYLSLLILGVDLFGKLLQRFRVLPERILQNPVTKILSLTLVFSALVVVLSFGNKRYNHIVVNSFNIHIPAGNAEIKSLKICFVADLHLNNHTSQSFIDDYFKKVSQIKPDIVLYGGDILERGRISKGKLSAFDKRLFAIKPRFGQFIVSGNHDPFRFSGYHKDSGITFLNDTLVKVANSFYLMGLHYRSFSEKPIAKLMMLAKEDLPVILLDHSPYQLELASKNHIDIQLSGHTHNGQVWPINYIVGLLYELPWGYKKINDLHVFVTSGIQGWGTPIRTAGKSEIMVINLEFVN